MNNKIPLLCIVGPTASGKTGLSVELAERYNGEIVSCDSMQIYKGMDIATAKVTKEEARGIPHHLVDFLPIGEAFSVSDYVKLAHKVIAEIYERGKLPILVGGTGLYYSSLVGNITFSEEKIDEKLRAELNEQYQREGGEILLKQLAEFDPETASTLHPNNGKRIIRAIEIYRNTGITMSVCAVILRSRLAAMVSAHIASTTTTARGTINGSWRPLIVSSIGSLLREIVCCGRKIEGVGRQNRGQDQQNQR